MAKRRGKRRGKKQRGIGPVAAVVVTGAICCWTGLVRVDRQIRAVTINQSPPLWETREVGDVMEVTLLGRGIQLDLGPVRRTGRALGEEAVQILHTPAAPERLWQMAERVLPGERR